MEKQEYVVIVTRGNEIHIATRIRATEEDATANVTRIGRDYACMQWFAGDEGCAFHLIPQDGWNLFSGFRTMIEDYQPVATEL